MAERWFFHHSLALREVKREYSQRLLESLGPMIATNLVLARWPIRVLFGDSLDRASLCSCVLKRLAAHLPPNNNAELETWCPAVHQAYQASEQVCHLARVKKTHDNLTTCCARARAIVSLLRPGGCGAQLAL
ncbi:Hypothetical predicted protein [Olea europaea subsp. europaea]|uniref:Uncharacterized protein n=1 Tax=Olea europaea subsp. europaea TaxID=158383 RepID=A0A8S0TNR5_OLEEU|nr:Hypothetical predicted protein [Olea europaea subsp. europaea]